MTKAPPDAPERHKILPAILADKRPIDEVTHWPDNPRRGNVAVVRDSLDAHGQYKQIIVQASTGHAIVGNHTLAAARELGWTHIAVTEHDLPDDEARAIAIVDNRSGDLAEWDIDALRRQLEMLPDPTHGTGYDQASLDDLIAAASGAAAGAGPAAPGEFPPVDPDGLPVAHRCPSCGYEWSGNAS